MAKTEAELRADKAERQRRWRERTAGREPSEDGDEPRSGLGAAVTLHLTDRECAALDALARSIYQDNPHDPARGVVSSVYPGRPAALRELIRRFRERAKPRRPASREACAAFWRSESAYRKATRENTTAEAPTPPWR